MLGEVPAIAQGGVGHGADFHGNTLFQHGPLQFRITIQIEAVTKAVYPAAEGDGYLLILPAEAFSGVEREAKTGILHNDLADAVFVAGKGIGTVLIVHDVDGFHQVVLAVLDIFPDPYGIVDEKVEKRVPYVVLAGAGNDGQREHGIYFTNLCKGPDISLGTGLGILARAEERRPQLQMFDPDTMVI